MSKFIKKQSESAALPPGTLIHVGEKRTEKVKITVIDYNETEFNEEEIPVVEECFPFKDKPSVTWINIDGIHELSVIEKIGQCFELHPLVLEDIVNAGQRPKMEDLEKYIFVVLKMLMLDEKKSEIISEQVSLVLGKNYVISFQEKEGDVFNAIRDRIRNGKGRIRKMGSDYLAYSLMDAIVDNYFIILEKTGEKVENIEEDLVSDPDPKTLQAIHNMKREMIFLRKSVWPLREIISGMERGASQLIKKTTRIYLRDVYDHTIQVIDTVETMRDIISGMLDIYLSSLSNRMNEVMKVLTIIATIFIPLTFIAGVYGMNFKYMPELDWRFSYPIFWVAIITLGTSLFLYFKKRGWLD